ncbi:glycosyltransferase [Halalkalibacter akibai]|uniref:Probable galactosyl transferase n=1 Tax=Halalkalibacter akibai (strain ATCC 43226 / DSM 21942 / CIP 109018 / JCM 9157 / 1139) TaxID=1236973 RepID=W4QV25_HALA3|nr:glycosyltransferase [Halalkalibacter akibai]GAE35931.1 probable galactosyl transferase [Halalkalibacter akibai JCM 9157]
MKKKIIFMLINMNIGGTEKALLNMISELPQEKYDVTIFMLEKSGGLLNDIPKDVNVEFMEGYEDIKDLLSNPPHLIAWHALKKREFLKAFNLIVLHLIYKITNNRSLFFKYLLKNQQSLKDNYDVAVAYAGPMDVITYFVLNKIKAQKKIQWIHFDINKVGFNQAFASKIYTKFDKVYVVSSEGKKLLADKLPKLTHKIDTFYNVISKKNVLALSALGKGFEDGFDGVRILTVGRLSLEKGQDLTIPILARLKRNGYKVRWYCIGEGSARTEYQQLIKEYNLEEDFILLGSKQNPYPYMKQCDIYVQPSRHEGYCITLAEARCFNNPIISTNFTGASEQITHGKTGLIVKENYDLYSNVEQLIINKNLESKIRRNLALDIVDSKKEVYKLYKLIENKN